MANELSKIERMGLANEVQDLLASGDYPTATAIAEKLRQTHNIDISDSAVQRYVAKVKDAVAPDAARKLREHVNNELPKDLDALEAIQRQAQAWWTEEPADTAERLARAYVAVEARVEAFVSMIRGAILTDDKDRQRVVKGIIDEVSNLFAKDLRLQKKRMDAMRLEADIIKVKLINAGALDKETRGNIVIVDKRRDYRPAGDNTGTPFVVKGGSRG